MMIDCPASRAARAAPAFSKVTRRSISSGFIVTALMISTETSAKFRKKALRVAAIQAASRSGKQAASCMSMTSWRYCITWSRRKARKLAIPYQAGSGRDDSRRSHQREALERLAVLEVGRALAEALVADLLDLGR